MPRGIKKTPEQRALEEAELEAKRQLKALLREQRRQEDEADRRNRAEAKETARQRKLMIQTFIINNTAEGMKRFEAVMGPLSLDDKRVFARSIGNDIQDMASIKTGKISILAKAERDIDPKYRPTEEHCYPNQVAGMDVLSEYTSHSLDGGFVPDAGVDAILALARRVNLVTKDENSDLIPYQKYGVYTTPEESYRKAGIELVDDC